MYVKIQYFYLFLLLLVETVKGNLLKISRLFLMQPSTKEQLV